MKLRFLFLFVCGFTAGAANQQSSGSPDKSTETGQVDYRHVFLANPLARTLKFATSCDEGKEKVWTKRELEPRSGDLYGCHRSWQTLFVRVSTSRPQKKEIVRTLENKKRYEFFWNATESRWDIRELTPRK